MKILLALNAFKNSLDAVNAAEALKRGIIKSKAGCEIITLPVADGGDGTSEIIGKFMKGRVVRRNVLNPVGKKIKAGFYWIRQSRTAVTDMASASGLALLRENEKNPLRTTSFGTGQLIMEALNLGAGKIILGVGGSATVDGGCGMLAALGVGFIGKKGKILKPVPEKLKDLDKIDLSGLDKRLSNCSLIVMCDVENKLLGEKGSAAVFGPQKGASRKDVKELEAFLKRLAEKVKDLSGVDVTSVKFSGAAGGAPALLYSFAGAQLENGIDYFFKITLFEEVVKESDLVITGEGRLDDQTLDGKGPLGVARIARKFNKPVIAVAGYVPLMMNRKFKKYFEVVIGINNDAMCLKDSIRRTRENLERTGEMIGNMLNLKLV